MVLNNRICTLIPRAKFLLYSLHWSNFSLDFEFRAAFFRSCNSKNCRKLEYWLMFQKFCYIFHKILNFAGTFIPNFSTFFPVFGVAKSKKAARNSKSIDKLIYCDKVTETLLLEYLASIRLFGTVRLLSTIELLPWCAKLKFGVLLPYG